MNKIDFAIVITAENCNPNGDPLNGNRPRQNFEGRGYMTDVCLKRKIRDRLQEMGESILIVANDKATDGYRSIKERVHAVETLKSAEKERDFDTYRKEACKIWIDVRTFGQVFAYKGEDGSVSQPVRGPVSIRDAVSLEPINIIDCCITKSTNLDAPKNQRTEKGSDTVGFKYFIDKGAYVAYGSVFPYLAEKTGFTEEDLEKLKHAMINLLENDASFRRPSGSMSSTLYWWKHSSAIGKNSALVHRSLNIRPTEEWPYFLCDPEEIRGVELEIY